MRRRAVTGFSALTAVALGFALPAAVPPAGAADALSIPGLSAPARIVTDRFGVPHIQAANLSDLYLCWGFVTARDRLWQLDYSRRAGRGELWAWLGNRALRGDGGAQLFELATRAVRIWERERRNPETRDAVEHYVAGINAYVARCRGGREPLPEEFARLGRAPDFWRPEDCYIVLFGLGFTLDFALPELAEGDSIRAHGTRWLETRKRHESDYVFTTIPDTAAARLYGPRARSSSSRRSERAAPGAGGTPSLVAAARRTLGDWLSPATAEPDLRASNIFAVGPRRSASGRPMLANDPHLGLAMPSPFHVLHLSVPGAVDAIGAAVPGLPAIVSGRNRCSAWGITALSADVMDVYADTLSRDGRRVNVGGRWMPVREASYAMRFRLGPLYLPTFGPKRRYTPHGPVVVWDPKGGVAYAVRWAGRDDDITIGSLLGLERLETAPEIAARFRTLVTPTINVVAADVDGHVVYQAVGALPRRGFPAPLGPLPGDGRHEWQGLIAPDDLPRWEAPPSGFVVNGNNLPVGPAYPVELPGFDWIHDRAQRMADRLAGDPSITLDNMRSIQNDVFSRGAQRLVPRLLRCADSLAATLSPRVRAALDTLRAWDYFARRSRVAPTLYRGWYGAFLRRSRLASYPGLAAAALDGRAPEALRAPGSDALERPATAAVAALESALAELEKKFGPDLSSWRWARAHRARFAHRLDGMDPGLTPPTIAVDGDNSTPCVSRSDLPWDITVSHAPVWRHLVDLAVPDSSLGVLPPGNSGRPGPHRADLLRRWASHGYVPLYLAWDRIETVKEDESRLVPVRR